MDKNNERNFRRHRKSCRLHWTVCCLSLLLFSACTTDTNLPDAEQADRLPLSLQMELPKQLTVVVTRAGEGKATTGNPTRNGIEIKKVRVMQFDQTAPDEDTYNIRKTYSKETTGTTTDWFTQTDGGLITINTSTTTFWNRTSKFYIIANAKELHSTSSGDGTDISETAKEAVLPTAYFTFPESDVTGTEEPGILAYGPVAYTEKTGTGSGDAKPVAIFARLKCAYAKVTVNYTAGTGVSITALRVENIRTRIYPFPATGNSPTDAFMNVDLTVNAGQTTYSFFMPENLRGNGTSTTAKEKNQPDNGPTQSGSARNLDYCTCIVLTGTYNYYPNNTPENAANPISVEYRFYPGADMIRNYDIERGKHYTLTLDLKGANSADARVTITDGNVFTIADPDDVTHKDDIVFGE